MILGAGIFLMAAVGLAIDGSHLYAQRQLAQAAADAAAQAGAVSMLHCEAVSCGTATNGGVGVYSFSFVTGTEILCDAAHANETPCYYARTLNGFNQPSDTVTVFFATGASLGFPSGEFTDPVIQVRVQRQVPTTLMRVLGWSTTPITATATAGISNPVGKVALVR